MGVDGLCELQEFCAVGKFEVFVVGEVEFEFEQRGDFQQLFAQSAQLGADASAQLADGNVVRCFVG